VSSTCLISFPLALLRAGTCAVDATNIILWAAIRSVGIGFRNSRSELESSRLFEQGEDLWRSEPDLDQNDYEVVTIGAELLGLDALPGGNLARMALQEAAKFPQVPFVKLKVDFLFALLREISSPGQPSLPDTSSPHRRMTWREFRVVCAIYSAQINRHGFVFLGWETISARASGEPRKEAARSRSLPIHSKLLSRTQIGTTVKKLEVLNFFMRFRYSRGTRGGYYAYSIRHATREELAKSIAEWAYANEQKIAANRQADQELCQKLFRRPAS
jgi:hypothetical protein